MRSILLMVLVAGSCFAEGYVGLLGGVTWGEHPRDYDWAEVKTEPGYAVGGMIGWQLRGWRLELEGIYRRHRAKMEFYGWDSVTMRCDRRMRGWTEEFGTVMGNVGGYLPRLGRLRPYSMVGIGCALFPCDFITPVRPEFAYQWLMGVEMEMGKRWLTGVQYRYLGIPEERLGHYHGVELVVRRKF